MCGIAGIWSPPGSAPPTVAELHAMASRLKHRGPDGQGVHVNGAIGLAHTRLAIVDLAGGAQPLCNEDQSVWVTFNGEIFNHRELRASLQAKGHRFKTQSDTEVLVHLYEDMGDAMVHELNGQFAFALWDFHRQRLLLARDRVGIRPLYFANDGKRLAFASEVKALFALPGVGRALSPEGLASVFCVWGATAPLTAFEGVHAIAPGHTMVVDAKGVQHARYWAWSFDPATLDDSRNAPRDENEAAEALNALLSEAVRLQLQADVPVGTYLSGGLDSSIIAASVRESQTQRMRTFSLNFDDDAFDEGRFQRDMVTHLRTEHSSVAVSHDMIANAFARMVWHAETPLVRTAPVPMMLLAELVRDSGFKVVLTGEGADEAFAGYDVFKEAIIRRRMMRSKRAGLALARLYPYLAQSPTRLGALTQSHFAASGSSMNGSEATFSLAPRINTTRRTMSFMTADWRERVQAWDVRKAVEATTPPGFYGWNSLARDQHVEASTLMSGYLLSAQGDRAAMAASVEARYPYLDHRVLEFAARLPARFKLRGLREKRILKLAWGSKLPASVSQRVKQPYRAPDSACFFRQGKPHPLVADTLSASRLRRVGVFDAARVDALLTKCADGRALGFGDNMALVGILSTMLMHEQFVEHRADHGAVR